MANDVNFLQTAGGASAIGAIGGLAQGAVNQLFYDSNLKKQVQAQKELTDYNNQASLELNKKMSNAVVAGMRNAGMNPAMLGGMPTSVGSSSPSAPAGQLGTVDLAGSISAVNDSRRLANETRLTEANVENIKADTEKKREETKETQFRASLTSKQVAWYEKVQNSTISLNEALTAVNLALKDGYLLDNHFKLETFAERVQQVFNTNEKTAKEIALLVSQIGKTDAETLVQKATAKGIDIDNETRGEMNKSQIASNYGSASASRAAANLSNMSADEIRRRLPFVAQLSRAQVNEFRGRILKVFAEADEVRQEAMWKKLKNDLRRRVGINIDNNSLLGTGVQPLGSVIDMLCN